MKIVVSCPWSVVSGILDGDNPIWRFYNGQISNGLLTGIRTELKDHSWLDIFSSLVVPALQAWGFIWGSYQ